ncbi:hypothetical protein SPBR_02344 [Sporothrix brasiliensis 5110]|uniref:Uncharacterized protein n=1 Tax=Sporothrix brasiliensis 5110 TaxID=1398154 RepID=A0A0C2IT97_9PEZI|nr:uncharacterized protein SPBR_02344 [Sporothrix brasiliensis 5110]KIH92301.1 hypothetical protein SPBR_02344 [Sporothrix brasiliensis 5110]
MNQYQPPRPSGGSNGGSGAWLSPATPSARSARSREGCLTCNLSSHHIGNGTSNGQGHNTANGMQQQLQLPDRPVSAFLSTLERPPFDDAAGNASGSVFPAENGPRSGHDRSFSTSVTASTSSSSSHLLSTAGGPSTNGMLVQQQQHEQQQQDEQPTSQPPPTHAVNQVFDFASFMWDSDDVWQDVRHQMGVGGLIADMGGVPGLTGATLNQTNGTGSTTTDGNGNLIQHQQRATDIHGNTPTQRRLSLSPQTVEAPVAENYRLMDYFIHAVTPPILAEVETQKKWLVMRHVLVGRANVSSMVRWAILAFSNFMLVQREGAWMASRQNHYENALAEVLAAMEMAATAAVLLDGGQRQDDTNRHGNDENVPGTSGTTESTTISAATNHGNTTDKGASTNGHAGVNVGYAAAGVAAPNDANGLNQNKNGNSKLHGRFLTGSVQARAPAAQPVLSLARSSAHRENLLATLFFLSYVDILEGRIDAAHANLKRAHDILKSSEKGGKFSAVERQFLLWLRLLDGRAVSAGGEGLFLSTDDEGLLAETPPAGALEAELGQMDSDACGAANGGPVRTMGSTDGKIATPTGIEPPQDDIEDVLFQILYQPGIHFFQKVQSFMGRISRIDPWHRSRGTVEDEIDVMNIGAAIAKDLRTLYDNRPMLMDYAVAGKLTAAHVSAHLAFAVTRSFRTYLCNYYASKVHLHRVAYKTLPLTQEATEALAQIRRLARLLVEALDAEDALPANMLWPLLMLGSEEPDPVERVWIHTQIMRMQTVAGNSKITAQVLAELQARQDAAQARVDIRSVMHAIFNSCFAIV